MATEELGATVENFASRLKRQLKEQEVANSENAKATQARQALLLKAMTGVRKALQETARISLGERFFFELDISDWEGWPRLELQLLDNAAPGLVSQALIATATDRNEQGILQLATRGGSTLAVINLKDESEFSRLPLVLKKSLRTFLDTVSNAVLNPPDPAEMLAAQTQMLEGTEGEPPGVNLLDEELFTKDSYLGDRNQVDLVAVPPTRIALSGK